MIGLKPRALKNVQAPVISELPPNTPVEDMPNGTIIRRKYKGKDHEVTVIGKNKFAYEGAVYDNLTAIAWKIYGYPKSGNYFFREYSRTVLIFRKKVCFYSHTVATAG